MSMYTLKILLYKQDFFVCWQNYNSYNILKFILKTNYKKSRG